jgi:hypothetical protein
VPSELFAGDARETVGDGPPLVERALHLRPEWVIDQLVHRPLDLVALEDEDDLTRRALDAVGRKANLREIEGRAPGDQLSGAGPTSLLQARDDRYTFHRVPLSAPMTVLAAPAPLGGCLLLHHCSA